MAAATIDPIAFVDPELAPALANLPPLALSRETLPQMRSRPVVPPLPAPAPQPRFRTIPGPKGAPEVRIMMIDGTGGRKGSPAYLHMHGGGYVGGKLEGRAANLQVVAEQCGCLVVSVDYRLAPETQFPGSLEDNYAALAWLNREAQSLGIDTARIAVGGESAGGGHAAILALAARERHEFRIAYQLLIFPMIDDRTGLGAPPPQIGRYVWTPGSNRFGWESFLGQAPGLATVPPGSVPARVTDLSGLPPAFIGVGGLDLFIDEDLDYARRLNAAGVATEVLVVPGAYHGFESLVPDARVSVRFRAVALDALKRGLGIG